MKQCKCGREIEDKYLMCYDCSKKDCTGNIGTAKPKSDKYLETLQQINWNLGMISKTLQALLPKDKLDEIKKQMKK